MATPASGSQEPLSKSGSEISQLFFSVVPAAELDTIISVGITVFQNPGTPPSTAPYSLSLTLSDCWSLSLFTMFSGVRPRFFA